jgi:hypothetical protein
MELPREILRYDIVTEVLINNGLLRIAKNNQLSNNQTIRLFMKFYEYKKARRLFNAQEYAYKLSKEKKQHPYEEV